MELKGKRPCLRRFPEQVDTGWTEENATKQEDRAVDLMHSDRKPLERRGMVFYEESPVSAPDLR